MLCARSGSGRLREAADLPRRTPAAVRRGARHPGRRRPAARSAGSTSPGWAPSRPPARQNPSATTCDRADFAKAGATRTRTRTYLIPEASLPARFGLSETYGRFRTPAAASRFLADVRRSVARCEDRDLATQVSGERREHAPVAAARPVQLGPRAPRSATSRRCASGSGFVRVGDTVAQLTFAPAPSDDMTATGFHSLLVRSGDRLRELG